MEKRKQKEKKITSEGVTLKRICGVSWWEEKRKKWRHRKKKDGSHKIKRQTVQKLVKKNGGIWK